MKRNRTSIAVDDNDYCNAADLMAISNEQIKSYSYLISSLLSAASSLTSRHCDRSAVDSLNWIDVRAPRWRYEIDTHIDLI